MKNVILRPLALFTILFFALFCILFAADTAERLLSAAIFSLLIPIALLLKGTLSRKYGKSFAKSFFKAAAFAFAGALLASLLSLYSLDVRLGRFEALQDKPYSIEGTVTDVVWDGGYSGYYVLKVSDLEDLPSFKCVLCAEGGLTTGDRVSLTARFSPLSRDRDGFDERRYYLSQNVVLRAEGENVRVHGKASPDPALISSYCNDRLYSLLKSFLSEDSAPFAGALLLGNKSELSDVVKRDFGRLGLSHVLAISGMHLTVLCSFAAALLSRGGKKLCAAGCIILILFYMFITGLGSSVTRSGLMMLFLIGSQLLRRSGDRFTALGLAVFLICLADPFAAADIGLQLSFAAVFSIFLFTEKREHCAFSDESKSKRLPALLQVPLRAVSPFFDGARITVVVVTFILPLQWLYFGEISLLSPLTSPLFSALATLLMWLLPFVLIFSPVEGLAHAIGYVCSLIIRLCCDLAQRLSLLEGICLSLCYPASGVFCVLLFLGCVVFCISRKKVRLCALCLTVFVFASYLLYSSAFHLQYKDTTRVSMVTYKSNDGLLVVSDDHSLAIDVSNGYSGAIECCLEEMEKVPHLELDALMLTHLHRSHSAALEKIFEQNIVRTLYLPYDHDSISCDITEVAKKHKVDVITYEPGDSIDFNGTDVVTYPYQYISRSVQPIIRIDLYADGMSFTYLGSAYFESFPDTKLSCNCLFLGGHGPLYKKTFTPNVSDGCTVFVSPIADPYTVRSSKKQVPSTVRSER